VRKTGSALRGAVRGTVAVLATFASYAAVVLGSILLLPWRRAKLRWQGRVFRAWSRILCRALGIHVRVEGAPPRPPFVLVSNHVSYLDILVLGTQLPCVFVAKAEIDDWPLFGAICRAVNTIFVDRKAKRDVPRVLADIETMLAAGQNVIIFPEGTSGPGDRVLPFRPSLLDLAARMGHPVHWAAIGYDAPPDGPPTHLALTWWGEMPLVPHIGGVLKLRRIDARIAFGAEPVVADDRKRLADALFAAVSGAFRPMVESAEIERLLALRETDPGAVPDILRPGAGPS
jgi:1-acyl-sn-glycerol-3-phosphate acyltransferase